MSLLIYKDLVDDCTVSCIPESGNFKCVGDSFLQKKDPFLYDENKLILKDGTGVDLYDGSTWRQFINRGDVEFDPAANLDTGDTLAIGNDYFVYLVIDGNEDPAIVVSLNTTYPDGFTADNSRKIGGFHVGHIRKVSEDGLWVPVDSTGTKWGSSGTKWQDNVTTGIVPNSVWDLKNRPKTLFGGMAQINKNFWCSIYLVSAVEAVTFKDGTGGLPVAEGKIQSRYGCLPLSGTESLNFFNFNELAGRQGLKLPTYEEWLMIAFGAPQGENGANNYAWAKTTNTSKIFTGCQINTSTGEFDNVSGEKPYSISGKNIVDTVGNLDKWIKSDFSNTTSYNLTWDNSLGADQGQAYIPNTSGVRKWRVGGTWSGGVHNGPRSLSVVSVPWSIENSCGAFVVCNSL